MKTHRRPHNCILHIATILALGSLPMSAIGQAGVTLLSPKAGEIYYAGYVNDSIAPWDSIIIEWKYDDTTGPKITQPVIEISPDNGFTKWATFRKSLGNMTKITATKFRCRIDTAGYDISLASPETHRLISETSVVRVYEYNLHSLGGISGTISVRQGPPPNAIRRPLDDGNGAHPAANISSNGSWARTLSVLGQPEYRQDAYAVNGQSLAGSARSGMRITISRTSRDSQR